MPAGTNITHYFRAPGDMRGYDLLVVGTLPASSPLTYTAPCASIDGVMGFHADATAAVPAGPAYQIASGNQLTVHFDPAQASRAFTLMLAVRR